MANNCQDSTGEDVAKISKRVLREYHDTLSNALNLKQLIDVFARKMFTKNFIGQELNMKEDKTYRDIEQQFLAHWINPTVEKVEDHLLEFLRILEEMGGPASEASIELKKKLGEEVNKSCKLKMPFFYARNKDTQSMTTKTNTSGIETKLTSMSTQHLSDSAFSDETNDYNYYEESVSEVVENVNNDSTSVVVGEKQFQRRATTVAQDGHKGILVTSASKVEYDVRRDVKSCPQNFYHCITTERYIHHLEEENKILRQEKQHAIEAKSKCEAKYTQTLEVQVHDLRILAQLPRNDEKPTNQTETKRINIYPKSKVD